MVEEQLQGSDSIKFFFNETGNILKNPAGKYYYKFMSIFISDILST